MPNRSKKLVLITLVILCVLVIIAYLVLKSTKKGPVAVQINTQGQPSLGNKNAPLHFVTFEDLKCGNCKIYNNTLFRKIKKQYLDTGKAKYTLINLAFIPGSKPAANTAHCLYAQNPEFFFLFVDYVYQNQPPEDQDWATTARLLQFAKAACPKADLKKLSECMIEGKYNRQINHNFRIATGVMGEQVATPSVYLNGRQVTPLSMPNIKKLADLH